MKRVFCTAVATLLGLALALNGYAQELPQMPKPQKEHEWLQKFAGEWTSEAKASFGPDQPEMTCTGTADARMLGGFWMISEGKSEMMGMPVESVLSLGYDTKKKKYVGTWMDNCHNHLWQYEGEVNEAGDTLTLNTEGPNPMLPGDRMYKYREVIEFQNKDHYVFSSMMQGEDGEWITFMTANFKRKK
jgi:hypothetical protein